MPRSRFVLVVVALIGVALGGLARPAGAEDKALAETLFIEGKEMLEQGKLEEACKRFRASHQAEASVGALLNLARCHMKMGKLASAWNEFREAATLAERMKQPDRQKGALDYAKELEPRLSKLIVKVEDPVDGLEVRRGDAVVPSDSYGVAVPVDPGRYEIVATAPGHRSWTGEVTIGAEKDEQTVTVPALGPERVVPEPVTPVEEEGLHPRAIAGLVVGGVGVLTLGVGIVLGAVAVDQDADLQCSEEGICPAEEFAKVQDIEPIAHASTATIVIGTAAILGGGILFLTAPRQLWGDTAFVPMISPEIQGLTFRHRF